MAVSRQMNGAQLCIESTYNTFSLFCFVFFSVSFSFCFHFKAYKTIRYSHWFCVQTTIVICYYSVLVVVCVYVLFSAVFYCYHSRTHAIIGVRSHYNTCHTHYIYSVPRSVFFFLLFKHNTIIKYVRNDVNSNVYRICAMCTTRNLW